MTLPVIVKTTKSGRDSQDVLSYEFTENRTIYLFEEITDTSALGVIAQLNCLDQAGAQDITLVINSPGGSVSAGFAIVDKMRQCKCDVRVICTGIAASMAAVLLSCGTKGKRYVSALSEVMIHQPLGGVSGQAADIELTAKHILKIREKINRLLAENTGHSPEKIADDCDRDYYMNAKEAVRYVIADHILE